MKFLEVHRWLLPTKSLAVNWSHFIYRFRNMIQNKAYFSMHWRRKRLMVGRVLFSKIAGKCSISYTYKVDHIIWFITSKLPGIKFDISSEMHCFNMVSNRSLLCSLFSTTTRSSTPNAVLEWWCKLCIAKYNTVE